MTTQTMDELVQIKKSELDEYIKDAIKQRVYRERKKAYDVAYQKRRCKEDPEFHKRKLEAQKRYKAKLKAKKQQEKNQAQSQKN